MHQPNETGTILSSGATAIFTATNALPLNTETFKGMVTATILYCQDSTISCSVSVLIKPPKLEKVTVSPPEKKISPGETVAFTATAYEKKSDGSTVNWDTTQHPLMCTWRVSKDGSVIYSTNGTNKMSFTHTFPDTTDRGSTIVQVVTTYAGQQKSAKAKLRVK